jgi:hypothetical protein
MPSPRPFPTEDDLALWVEEAQKASAAGGRGQTLPLPKVYDDLIRGGNFTRDLATWRRAIQRLPIALRLYYNGYMFRSIEKSLLDDHTMLRRMCVAHLKVPYESARFAILAMKVLGEYPGLFYAPSAERFFEGGFPSAVEKMQELIRADGMMSLSCDAVSNLPYPGSARPRSRSRTSPTFPYSTPPTIVGGSYIHLSPVPFGDIRPEIRPESSGSGGKRRRVETILE